MILCEDTRVTKSLLKRLGILSDQQLFRMDQYQEKRSFSSFDRAIVSGDVAYVTDAGSPGVSDPGASLIAYAREQGVSIKIVPGPSSLTAFISGCGRLFSEFYFGGFLPRKVTDMGRAMDRVIESSSIGIWFESPKRIMTVADYLFKQWPEVIVVFAKELTKPYETFFCGKMSDVYSTIHSGDHRGEWVLMVDAREHPLDYSEYRQRVAKTMKDVGLSAKQVKAMAPLFDCPKNELYDIFQAL